jgi:hypothetical protein
MALVCVTHHPGLSVTYLPGSYRVGGLQDLRRRRYITDVGHKSEVFKVTREGFEAADQLGTDGGS